MKNNLKEIENNFIETLTNLDPVTDAKEIEQILEMRQKLIIKKKTDSSIIAAAIAGTTTIIAAAVTAVCNVKCVDRITKFEENNIISSKATIFLKK